VERLGDWGAGGVYLIEIPSDAEKYDNIVAFWVPDRPAGEGFVVDFTSPTLRLMSPKAKVDAEVSAAGTVSNVVVHKNEGNGTWRLSFELEPEKGKNPTEMRAILRSGRDILTESWVYQWNAP